MEESLCLTHVTLQSQLAAELAQASAAVAPPVPVEDVDSREPSSVAVVRDLEPIVIPKFIAPSRSSKSQPNAAVSVEPAELMISSIEDESPV